jgi:hypothetical protein
MRMVSPSTGTSTERPVFVADHPWRPRVVSAAIALVGALLLGWLVAIVMGAVGFGSLPALPFTEHGKGSSAAIGSRPNSNALRRGAAGVGTPDMLRREDRVGSDRHSAPGADGSSSTRGRSGRDVKSGSGHGHGSLTAADGVSAKNGSRGNSAGSGTSGGASTGNGTAAPTGGGNASTTSRGPSSGAPTATPSGNEIPSGSASGPSDNANSSAGGTAGDGRGSIMLTPG